MLHQLLLLCLCCATELESQTTVLRAQANARDSCSQVLVKCQAELKERQAELQQLRQQHQELQELSQVSSWFDSCQWPLSPMP